MLKIALPNGSLEKGTFSLFEQAGLKVIREPRAHKAEVQDPRISEAVVMRPQHMPGLVAQGAYDLGICGWDCVLESGAEVVKVAELNYSRFTSGRVKIVLLGSADDPTERALQVAPGSTILSEYPSYTEKFFDVLGIKVNVVFSYGSTEAHIPQDYRYGVCVSERGISLQANRQKIVEVFFESATTLIAGSQALSDKDKLEAIHSLKLLLLDALSK